MSDSVWHTVQQFGDLFIRGYEAYQGGREGGQIVAGPGGGPPGQSMWPWDDAPPVTGGNGQQQQLLGGCQIEVPVQVASRASCPPGYVVVQKPGQGKSCMLKSVAISCHLWKAPRKPPIKASDWRCLMKAGSVINKLDRVVATSNKITGKASLKRTRASRKR